MALFKKNDPPKSILITGCSEGGIGHALAMAFSKAGCRVYATARRAKKMEGLKGYDNIKLLELDVTNAKSVNSAARQVRRAARPGRATLRRARALLAR
jgi:1-acylglycerone phosphate reductase